MSATEPIGSPWGWAGTVHEFLQTPDTTFLAALSNHHRRLLRAPPASTQTDAWREEHRVLTATLRLVFTAKQEALGWGIAFEYELPLEGGRRPDIVLLAGGSLVVLEFKSTGRVDRAAVDQTAAYARDLAEYHASSQERPIYPVLVLTKAKVPKGREQGVEILDVSLLAATIERLATPGTIDLSTWLNSDYRPLPFLVEAARRIFANEPLPHIKRALSAGIPEAVELLGQIAEDASRKGQRALVMLTGVPGSGKTLAGLRLVYERVSRESGATFLSGNGPLVEVLQDALRSRTFVRDLHAFVRTYGLGSRAPREHVIVFDEAQRAWDRAYMNAKRRVPKGEPEILIEVGEKVAGWATLVGLVGEGQEIYSGEEGGLHQWAEAVRPPTARQSWRVHCAPRLAVDFQESSPTTHKALDLTLSLRSRRAEQLHAWVSNLLEGGLPFSARLATRMHEEAYPLYVTRDLQEAKSYVRLRYEGDNGKKYGLLSSSHARILPKYGVDNGWLPTSRLNIAKWYNAPATEPESCCSLTATVTEFACQGLELDLPIICWGEDYAWTGTGWRLTPIRRRYAQQNPEQLLKNTYRVLLTRGRDGLVVFLPSATTLDLTEHALLAAGVRPIPQPEELAQLA